jgi:hypothetical protein
MKPMKLLRAVIVLLMLLGIGFVLFSHYGIPSYSRPQFTLEGLTLPPLTVLSVIDAKVDLENGQLTIVTVIDTKTSTGDQAAGDVVKLYRWGNEILKAGDAMDIYLLAQADTTIPVVEGKATPYYILMQTSLERTQIQRMLRQPPITLQQLLQFVTQVATDTQNAGGQLFTADKAIIYTGLGD